MSFTINLKKINLILPQTSKNWIRIGVRKLYVVMASDVKVRNGKIDTTSILAFLRQDVA